MRKLHLYPYVYMPISKFLNILTLIHYCFREWPFIVYCNFVSSEMFCYPYQSLLDAFNFTKNYRHLYILLPNLTLLVFLLLCLLLCYAERLILMPKTAFQARKYRKKIINTIIRKVITFSDIHSPTFNAGNENVFLHSFCNCFAS